MHCRCKIINLEDVTVSVRSHRAAAHRCIMDYFPMTSHLVVFNPLRSCLADPVCLRFFEFFWFYSNFRAIHCIFNTVISESEKADMEIRPLPVLQDYRPQYKGEQEVMWRALKWAFRFIFKKKNVTVVTLRWPVILRISVLVRCRFVKCVSVCFSLWLVPSYPYCCGDRPGLQLPLLFTCSTVLLTSSWPTCSMLRLAPVLLVISVGLLRRLKLLSASAACTHK